MKVILNRDIKNLGKVGSIVAVKSGYGRNFLLPKKYAIVATKENIAKLEQKLEELKVKNSELIEKAKQIADILDNTVFNTIRQASDDDTIYGSVRTKDVYSFIINLLKGKNINFPLDIGGIKITKPIKMLGQYIVFIEIYSDITGSLRLNVCRTTADFEEDTASFDKKKEKALALSEKKDIKKQCCNIKQNNFESNNTDISNYENEKVETKVKKTKSSSSEAEKSVKKREESGTSECGEIKKKKEEEKLKEDNAFKKEKSNLEEISGNKKKKCVTVKSDGKKEIDNDNKKTQKLETETTKKTKNKDDKDKSKKKTK